VNGIFSYGRLAVTDSTHPIPFPAATRVGSSFSSSFLFATELIKLTQIVLCLVHSHAQYFVPFKLPQYDAQQAFMKKFQEKGRKCMVFG
jgi:hypothetical protein